MVTPHIAIPHDKIADFCRRHHIRRLALFGSVLRDDFKPDSDIDVLVDFEEGFSPRSFSDYLDMKDELQAILGREVDILQRRLIERSENYIRRKSILDSAQVIYER